MTDCVFVYVTASSPDEARGLARAAVGEHLAACANVLGPIESYYFWEGKFESGAETALVLKTTQGRLEALTERLRELHSYSCPAIVAMPIVGGHPAFLAWIGAETGDARQA